MVMGFLGEISKVMFEVLEQDTATKQMCMRRREGLPQGVLFLD